MCEWLTHAHAVLTCVAVPLLVCVTVGVPVMVDEDVTVAEAVADAVCNGNIETGYSVCDAQKCGSRALTATLAQALAGLTAR